MVDEVFTPGFFRRLQQLKIRTRRTFLGSRQGSHTSLRRGHGLEFSDYRLYAQGDDFRHIDWNVYGRTDRLYMRQFREEQDLNVLILIDASASMAYPRGEKKFELAVNLALALGYVALSDGDTVTFSILGQRNTPRYSGQRALSRMIRELRAVQPGGTFNFEEEIRAAIARQKIPGKCFFISDFLFEHVEQIASIDLLRAKNFDISVLQVLAPSELNFKLEERDAALVVDSETGQEVVVSVDGETRRRYAEELSRHIAALEGYCYKSAIVHVLLSSAQPVGEVVLNRLPELGLLK